MGGTVDWDAYSSLHRADDGGGLLDAAKILRQGTLGELVRYVMLLPEDKRMEYAIQKAGGRRLDYADIAALAAREGFPRS
ncbi:MAG TPA: hypothetical protein VK839_06625 [Erythrobacter sp.]|nr:hypothetical protein [Erythrobacter sp.]